MRSSIESVGNFGLLSFSVDDFINHSDDVFGELIKVENGRICVKTNRVKTVAVLDIKSVTLMISYANSL